MAPSGKREAGAHLREDYWRFCGADDRQRVELVEARYTSSGETVLMVDTTIAAQSLDYIILDEDALRSLDSRQLAMDLKTLPSLVDTVGEDGKSSLWS